MKNVAVSFAVLAILAFASCKKSYNLPANSGYVMFVNACNGSDQVFVASKNALVFSSDVTYYPGPIPYFGSSKYQVIPAGIDSIFFTLDAYDTLVAGAATITQDNFYSVFASGSLAAPIFEVIPDFLPALVAGKAEVRLVNLSSDVEKKTASIGNTLIGPISYGYSSFQEILPGAYTVTAGDIKNSNEASISGQFADGKIYTIVVTGSASGTGASALALAIIDNNQLLN